MMAIFSGALYSDCERLIEVLLSCFSAIFCQKSAWAWNIDSVLESHALPKEFVRLQLWQSIKFMFYFSCASSDNRHTDRMSTPTRVSIEAETSRSQKAKNTSPTAIVQSVNAAVWDERWYLCIFLSMRAANFKVCVPENSSADRKVSTLKKCFQIYLHLCGGGLRSAHKNSAYTELEIGFLAFIRKVLWCHFSVRTSSAVKTPTRVWYFWGRSCVNVHIWVARPCAYRCAHVLCLGKCKDNTHTPFSWDTYPFTDTHSHSHRHSAAFKAPALLDLIGCYQPLFAWFSVFSLQQRQPLRRGCLTWCSASPVGDFTDFCAATLVLFHKEKDCSRLKQRKTELLRLFMRDVLHGADDVVCFGSVSQMPSVLFSGNKWSHFSYGGAEHVYSGRLTVC